MDTQKSIVLIANGKNKNANKLKEQLRDLLPANFSILLRLTNAQAHAIELATKSAQEAADFIIAVGGDGTLNEVINGIMNITLPEKKEPIIGLLPQGTGNDFARTAKLSKSVTDLANLILNKNHKKLDLGKVCFTNFDGNKDSRYFANIAEIGVGAKTVEIVNKSNKTLGSTLTFFLGVLRAFVGYKKQAVEIQADNFQWAGKVVTVCLANGQYFGSGLGIAPRANLSDGLLCLVVIGNIRVSHFLRYLPHLRKLKEIKIPKVKYLSTKWCEITSKNPYPIEMDGENIGTTPFSTQIVPAAIDFLFP